MGVIEREKRQKAKKINIKIYARARIHTLEQYNIDVANERDKKTKQASTKQTNRIELKGERSRERQKK